MKQIYLLLLGVLFFVGCHDTKIGYLKTENASYGIDSLIIRKELTDNIQGVLGTAPIRYKLSGVKAPSVEAETIFLKEFKVRGGGRMELPLYTELPVGRYVVSLYLSNEDYSAVLTDVYTFIVKEK